MPQFQGMPCLQAATTLSLVRKLQQNSYRTIALSEFVELPGRYFSECIFYQLVKLELSIKYGRAWGLVSDDVCPATMICKAALAYLFF
jgi:hypothetical protein